MIRSLLSATIVAILAQPSVGGTVVISDNDYLDADWSARLDGTVRGSGNQFVEGSMVPLGGNPSAYRQLRSHGARFGFGPANNYIGWHFFEGDSYDPSLGAVTSVSVQEDVLLSEDGVGEGRLAIRQDGIIFRSKESYAVDALNTWVSRELTDLLSSDFEAFFNGSFLPTASPDFSINGAELFFGVYRSAVLGGRRAYNSRTGTDNWRVTLTTEAIPEPASVFMALAAGCLACVRRKTQHS